MDPQYLLPDPPFTAARRRIGTSRARAIRDELGDYRVTVHSAQQTFHAPDAFEPLLPTYPSEYDLPPLSPDADHWTWLIES